MPILANLNFEDSEKPLVSICVLTYNHESYVEQAIESFLMQNVNFKVEILIHDDASKDDTQLILKKYEKDYPGLFKLLLQEENQRSKLGGGMNPRFNYPRAKGKYIALCDGDDYWIDPLKLQKQVDILEKHDNIYICLHPAYSLIDGKILNKKYGYWGNEFHIISPEKVISNYITAGLQTIVFRNIYTKDYFGIVRKPVLGGHSSLQIFYSLIGNGAIYLPDYMATYRVDSTSSISKTLFKQDELYLERQINNLYALDRINKATSYKYRNELLSLKYYRINRFFKNIKISYLNFILFFFKKRFFIQLKFSYILIISLLKGKYLIR